jgi:hypothetical protein
MRRVPRAFPSLARHVTTGTTDQRFNKRNPAMPVIFRKQA